MKSINKSCPNPERCDA